MWAAGNRQFKKDVVRHTPDARCRGASSETNVQVPNTSGSSTPGNTTVTEAKIDAQVNLHYSTHRRVCDLFIYRVKPAS